jgi:alpha-amylase
VYALEDAVLEKNDPKLIDDWRKLQTSDHFYYMCTKWSEDGDVHAYFSPYESPYDAYIAYMNALSDLRLRASR